MNGTSEPSSRRNRSSVSTSLSATRSMKRPASAAWAPSLNVEGEVSCGSASDGFCTGSVLMGRSGSLDRVEGDHLLQPPVPEPIHPAALEVPPGLFQVVRRLNPLDP